MTYFEYVSVAISLIFAFAVTDILRSLTPALSSARRYYPHYAWLVALFTLIFYVWMYLWEVQSIEWTGPILFYAFLNPAITTVMARLLTTSTPESIDSFRKHFRGIKKVFFVLLWVFAANALIFDWVIGQQPWGTFGETQYAALFGISIAILGLVAKKEITQHVLATLFVLMMVILVSRVPAYA